MKSLTKGTPIKLILTFAIPLFIGQLFQLFYSIMDTHIVGVTLGENALAAVGSTSTLSDLMIHLLNGLTNGFAIIVANRFGAKDYPKMKRAAAGVFSLGVLFTLGISACCVIFLRPILGILNVPEEIYTDAYSYIRIIMIGLLASALYNSCAAVLRAIGDSVTPLLFLILSSFLNILLDYTLILAFHMGTAGAALATVISQVVSFVLCLIYMWVRYPLLRFSKEDFLWEKDLVVAMLKTGTSMAFMSAFVSFGTLCLQTAINTFGTQIIVAHTAARKVTMVFMLPFGVFGQTMATFCGQNYGAGEYGRIRTGIIQTTLFTWGWCALVVLCAYLFSPALIQAVTGTDNGEITRWGSLYLKFDTPFYFVPTVISVIRNSMQGFGDTVTPVVSSSVELFGKLLIALFLAPAIGYWGIIISEPIVWFLMVIPLIWQLLKNPVFKKASPV